MGVDDFGCRVRRGISTGGNGALGQATGGRSMTAHNALESHVNGGAKMYWRGGAFSGEGSAVAGLVSSAAGRSALSAAPNRRASQAKGSNPVPQPESQGVSANTDILGSYDQR